MPGKVFTLDLDGVLYDMIGGCVDLLYSRFGITIDRNDITDYRQLTKDPDVNARIYTFFGEPVFYWNLKPFPEAFAAVELLKQNGSIIAVSARPDIAYSTTILALKRDFNFRIGKLTLTNNKVRVAKDEKSRYAVEDSPKNAREFADSRIRTWLIRTSYSGSIHQSKYLKIVDNVLEAAEAMVRPLYPTEDT